MDFLLNNKLVELEVALKRGEINRGIDIVNNLKSCLEYRAAIRHERSKKQIMCEVRVLMKYAFDLGEERLSRSKFDRDVMRNEKTFEKIKGFL